MMNFDLQKMDMTRTKNKTKFPKKRKTILMSVALLSQKMTMGKGRLKIISQRSRHLLLART